MDTSFNTKGIPLHIFFLLIPFERGLEENLHYQVPCRPLHSAQGSPLSLYWPYSQGRCATEDWPNTTISTDISLVSILDQT